MLSVYPACFYKEENGYSVIFPDLNWLATQGDTLQEAMGMAIDCLAGYIHTCKRDNEPLPEPSGLSDIDPLAIAKELDPDSPPCESFVNMVSVDVEAYAKEHFEKSVKKTLSIPAWLNKAALEQGINFSQTLQEALLAKLRA
ncbi:MAG: type II toxin-antitoxin system HicB family antitoxin [Clostridium sp.]|jgi:predicted RNase H-like HicB family nuclease|nr:type II toxin-antitoxin system HicB family antitoxin [Clostridium sp.]